MGTTSLARAAALVTAASAALGALVALSSCQSSDASSDGPGTTETGPVGSETGTTPPTSTAETGSTGETTGTTPPPALGGNVLILLADDLSPAFVGVYGETVSEVHTPVIDGLAREGMLFRNAWAYAECSPDRTALVMGRHARRTGAGVNVQPTDDPKFEISPDEESYAEMLARSTAFTWSKSYFGKWHVPDPTGGLPGARLEGFDYFQGTNNNLVTEGPELLAYFDWNKQENTGAVHQQTGYVTSDTVDDAIARLQGLHEPWVIQVAFHAPHNPRHVPPPDLQSYDLTADSPPVDLYDAMVEAMDTEIGRLLASVPADVRSRTTVIFMGDNGSPDLDLPGDDANKLSLTDGGVRVPLVVQGPLVGVPGSESEALVSVVDVLPTLAELAGVTPRSDRPLDGVSLVPALADPTAPAHTRIWSERFDPPGFGPYDLDKVTVRDDHYKLLRDRLTGRDQFFEYVPGALDEGPDLLHRGPLTAAQQAAYEALAADVDARIAAMQADQPYPM